MSEFWSFFILIFLSFFLVAMIGDAPGIADAVSESMEVVSEPSESFQKGWKANKYAEI